MAQRNPIEFTDADRQRLDHERYHHAHWRVRQRMELLWLISQGEAKQRAAALAGVSRITAWRYERVYREGGIDALRRVKWEGSCGEWEPHRLALEAAFAEHPPHTVGEAARRIERITGLRRRPTAVRELLHSMGLRWRRTAAMPVPPKKTSSSTPAIRPSLCETNWNPA